MSNNKKNLRRILYTHCIQGPVPLWQPNVKTTSNLNHLVKTVKAIGNDSAVEIIESVAKEDFNKNRDFILLALAACTVSKEAAVSTKAYNAVENICMTSKSILQFVEFCEFFSKSEKKTTGWGKLRRRTVQKWYRNQRPYDLVYSITGCQIHNHWCHKDLWRLCHIPVSKSAPLGMRILCSFVVSGFENTIDKFKAEAEEGSEEAKLLKLLEAVKEIRTSKPHESGEKVAKLMIEHKLSWYHLPVQWHNDSKMWKHLINYVPLRILVKNLPRLHKVKVLDIDSAWQKCVVERILDVNSKTCLHPIEYYWHQLKYEQGRASRKKIKWIPNVEISSALKVAFHLSIKCQAPTQKILDITVDLSLPRSESKVDLHSSSVVAALCYVWLHTEDQNCEIKSYPRNIRDYSSSNTITKEDSIETIKAKLLRPKQVQARTTRGTTRGRGRRFMYHSYREPSKEIDFARPVIHAKMKGKTVDTFIVITDATENDATGKTKSRNALTQYKKINPKARLVTILMQSSSNSINDEEDSDILEINGFDSQIHSLVKDFIMEKF